MTPEELEEFKAQLAESNRLKAEEIRMQAVQVELLTKMAQAQGINVDAITKSKNAFDGLKGSTSKQSAAAESNAHSLKVMDDAMANFNKTLTNTTASAVSFGKAMLSNEQGFAKYNQALSSAGDAAMSLGKNFGIFGFALGGAIKGLTMAAEQFTKQADSTLKATDDLSKIGGAGSLTADQVLKMGHEAGLTSKNLDVMTKAAGKVNSGMAILGSTVGEGMVAFGKITAVTSEQRQAFQRLGVSQEELMNRQADYIKQQEMSGMSLSKDQAKVKKESLEYAEQLSRLSVLTGKSADKIQAEQDAVQLEYEEVLAQQVTQRKIAKLEKEGGEENLAAAAKLREDEKKRIDFQKTVTATYGKETGLQAARVARTGQIDEKTKGLITRGITVDDVQAGAKKGEQGGAEFNEKLKEGTGNLIDAMGDAIGRSSNAEQLGKSLGLDQQSVQVTGNLSGRKETEALANATALTKGASSENPAENNAAGGKSATDPAQIARNKLTEAEIAAKVKIDELVAEFNPLLKGFNATTLAAGALMLAATAAALALGKMAASAAMNKMGMGGPDIPDKKGKGKESKAKPARARDPKTGRYTKEAVKDASALGKMAGSASKVASTAGKFAGPAAGVLAVGAGAMTAYQGAKDVDEKVKSGELTKDEGTVKKSEAVGTGVGQAAGGAAGAWGGAAAGAAMGSIVPVVGTVIGGLLGAAVGGWLGSKGGEMVGENVGTTVGKSIIENPTVDASGRATAATDPRVVGTQQNPASVKTTDTPKTTDTQKTTDTPKTTGAMAGATAGAISLADIQANMSKGMSQKDAQKTAEEQLAKMSGTTLVQKDMMKLGISQEDMMKMKATPNAPALQKGDLENPATIAKQMKEDALKSAELSQADTLKLTKASDIQEASIITLNKTLLATNNALKDLTSSIADVTDTNSSTTSSTAGTTSAFGIPGGMNMGMTGSMINLANKSSGGISVPGGVPSSFKASGSASSGAGGMPSSLGQTASKKSPAVGSAPPISIPSMGSSGTDGGPEGKTGTGSTDMPKAATAKGSSASLDEQSIKDMIIKHEGKVNKPYKDSLGLWTVGVGHLIGDGKTLPDSWNREFSNDEIMKMFDEDYKHHRDAAEKIPGFDKFNSAGQGALTDLTFNMGPSWYKRFPNTAKQIEKGNAEGAAAGLEDSKWYTQVGKRAPAVVGLIAQGGIQAKDGGIADGPMEGYPATLHGNEAILPLNPDSIITKLLNTSESQVKQEMNTNNNITTTTTEDMSSQIMSEMYAMMEEKFDAMIAALEDGNDHTEKLVKFSAV